MKKLLFITLFLLSFTSSAELVIDYEVTAKDQTFHFKMSLETGRNVTGTQYVQHNGSTYSLSFRYRTASNNHYLSDPGSFNIGSQIVGDTNQCPYHLDRYNNNQFYPAGWSGTIPSGGSGPDCFDIIIGEHTIYDTNNPNEYTFKWWDKDADGFIDKTEAFSNLSSFDPTCDNTFINESFTDFNGNGKIDNGESNRGSANSIEIRFNRGLPCDPENDSPENDEEGPIDEEDPCERELSLESFPVIEDLSNKFGVDIGIPNGVAPSFDFSVDGKTYTVDFGSPKIAPAITFFRGILSMVIYLSFGFAVLKTFSRW